MLKGQTMLYHNLRFLVLNRYYLSLFGPGHLLYMHLFHIKLASHGATEIGCIYFCCSLGVADELS